MPKVEAPGHPGHPPPLSNTVVNRRLHGGGQVCTSTIQTPVKIMQLCETVLYITDFQCVSFKLGKFPNSKVSLISASMDIR